VKFEALKIEDLFTADRDAGRLARKVSYIVACEASDGSWCEFDADSVAHAKVLADNAVDKLGARGCSVWRVSMADGVCHTSGAFPIYTSYWQPNEELEKRYG